MILTCPSCSASYNVDAKQIGPNGRDVRCKKCQHVWFQKAMGETPVSNSANGQNGREETAADKQALDELISRIQSSDVEIDDIGFDDPKFRSRDKKKPKKEKDPNKKSLVTLLVSRISGFKSVFALNKKADLMPHVAAGMVAVAVFSVVLFGLVSQRWTVVKLVPSLASVYQSSGFPLYDYSDVNPEEALIIDRVTISQKEGVTSVSGNIINVTSQNVKVPTFKLSFLDDKGAVLKEGTFHLPISVLNKEITFPFNIVFGEADVKGFSSISIKFAE